MPGETLTVALISDVFHDATGAARLRERLLDAKSRGAELAVLPELPLNPWSPATKTQREDDAETPNGPRHRVQSDAAKHASIGLIGGAIVRDAAGVRRNTSLVFEAGGKLVATYSKLHLPEEPGFWETSHYSPGVEPPRVVNAFSMPIGVQICSDINRPEGCHLLGAQGAEVIIAPRATKQATIDRWRTVFCANALTSTAYIVSVNRPAPEQGVLIGGPSIAVDPNGVFLLDTIEPVSVVTLKRSIIRQARVDYPGHLPVRADLYAHLWSEIAARPTQGR